MTLSRAGDSVPCAFHDRRASRSTAPDCSVRSPASKVPCCVGQSIASPYDRRPRMVEPAACDRKGWVSDAASDRRRPAARRAGGRAVRALQCAAAAEVRGDRDRRGTRRAGGGEAARRRGAAGGVARCGVRRGARSRRRDAGQRGIGAPAGTLAGGGSAGVLPDRRRGRAGRAGDRARRLRAVARAADLAALPRPRHAGRAGLSRALDRGGASVSSSGARSPATIVATRSRR